MMTVNFEGFNLKYYLALHPEMLPMILFLGLVGWLCELKRKFSKYHKEVEK